MTKRKDKKNKHTQHVVIQIPDNPDGETTIFSHLWVRCVYTFAAWFILGQGIQPGPNFFVALIMFSAPLLMDYLKFNPNSKTRKIIRRLGIGSSLLWIGISFFGMGDYLAWSNINGEYGITLSGEHVLKNHLPIESFPFFYIWCSIGFSAFLTGIDAVVFKSPVEIGIRNHIKDLRDSSITNAELEG